jgi:polyphosphate glucokinase
MKESGHILAIDVGGSHVKGTILSSGQGSGQETEYKKLPTPPQARPAEILGLIKTLAKEMPTYDKVSVGFPGYVRNGIVFTAPNLGKGYWDKVNLGQQVSDALGKPVRLVNDADQLGLGVVSGQGYELAVTLGTGVGTALLINGYLLPHIELAHQPVRKNRDYDAYLGNHALEKVGKEKWNKRVRQFVDALKIVFNYDRLYLGGGNADKLTFQLESNIHLFTNQDGIKGGAKLWGLEDGYHISTNLPSKGDA